MRTATCLAVLALTFAACGGGDDAATTTTSSARPSTTATEPTTTTTSPPDPLGLTAVQYLGLFNAQFPLVAADTPTDLTLAPIADGVYGSSVDVGTTILVFANTPNGDITAVSAVVDLDVTEGQMPARLVAGVPTGLTDDLIGVLEEFNSKVLPELSNVTQSRLDFDLTALDLIVTVEGQALTFTYVANGGDLPSYIDG